MTPLALIVALVQPARPCPADEPCAVLAGECIQADGFFLPPAVMAQALKANDDATALAKGLTECRDARDALRFDLNQCAGDLSSARKALGPPSASPAPVCHPKQQDGGPDFSRALWALSGAACVAGGWAAAEWSDVGAGWSVAGAGACAAGVGLLAWRW